MSVYVMKSTKYTRICKMTVLRVEFASRNYVLNYLNFPHIWDIMIIILNNFDKKKTRSILS